MNEKRSEIDKITICIYTFRLWLCLVHIQKYMEYYLSVFGFLEIKRATENNKTFQIKTAQHTTETDLQHILCKPINSCLTGEGTQRNWLPLTVFQCVFGGLCCCCVLFYYIFFSTSTSLFRLLVWSLRLYALYAVLCALFCCSICVWCMCIANRHTQSSQTLSARSNAIKPNVKLKRHGCHEQRQQ